MKIYLSGKITGTKDYKKRFNKAQKLIKKAYPDSEIVNPVKIGKVVEKNIKNPNWDDYMKACIKELLKCNAIYMIPGWETSKGAIEELNIARSLAYQEIFYIN